MKNKLAILGIIVFAALLYGLTLRGEWGNPGANDIKNNLDQRARPFELSPERGRYTHLIALAESHTYALDQTLAAAAYPDVGTLNGKQYSFFAPGISYLSFPFYVLGSYLNLAQVSSFAFISLVSIAALIFLYRICREILNLPIWASLAAVIIFAFGSTAWSYAITLYQHHVTTFLILSSFYATWRFRKKTKVAWLWALYVGISYGMAIMIDYPNAVLFLPIVIYLAMSSFSAQVTDRITISFRSAAIVGAFGFCAITALHLYHNQSYFGSWTRLSGSLPNYHLENPTIATSTPSLVAAAQSAPEAQKNVVGFFKEENTVRGIDTLLISADRGLFVYAPIFILSLLGMWFAIKRKLTVDMAILLSLVATHLFLYASWGDPWGGWAYGPRYMIPTMSVLAMFIGVFLNEARHKIMASILALAAFIYSSAIGLLGAITTNAVPPDWEAIGLHAKDNFMFNLDLLFRNESGSFAYKEFFSHIVSLPIYFAIILSFTTFIFCFVLVIVPRISKKDELHIPKTD